MGKTRVRIDGDRFMINDMPVYSDIPGSNPRSHGLLWNQRMIQGVFDDACQRSRYDGQLAMARFEPEANTDGLIAALPAWYAYGLRAITVCFQGGWPVGMVDVEDIKNNPFGEDGQAFNPDYAKRMDRIIRACDELGMVVIVNFLYWAQVKKMRDGRAIRSAVISASRFLKQQGYSNVIIDLANEYNIHPWSDHPLVNQPDGIASLIDLARQESGMLVGSSGGGGMVDREPCEASDFVLVHGNGLSRGQYFDFLKKAIGYAQGKPVICNEDSPCCTRVDVALQLHTSWGYYNNYTKQIPPCPWGVTIGEDLFFARRMARAIGIPVQSLKREEQFVLQGLAENERFSGGQATLRLAAEYPEQIDRVEFFKNGEWIYTAYDEPFFLNTETTWLGMPFAPQAGVAYGVKIHLVSGEVIEREAIA